MYLGLSQRVVLRWTLYTSQNVVPFPSELGQPNRILPKAWLGIVQVPNRKEGLKDQVIRKLINWSVSFLSTENELAEGVFTGGKCATEHGQGARGQSKMAAEAQ